MQRDYDSIVEKQRMNRLKFLIEKTTVYSAFLAEKFEQQQKERSEELRKEKLKELKDAELFAKKPEKKVDAQDIIEKEAVARVTRRGKAKPDEKIVEAPKPAKAVRKTKEQISNKRKAAEDYQISDYISKDVFSLQFT